MALFGNKKKETKAVSARATPQKSAQKATLSAEVDLSSVIRRPRITEKATLGIDRGTYVFEVDQRATKTQVKQAVEAIFDITPKKITMVTMRPQQYQARMRRRTGQKHGYKKAYVHLKQGDSLDITK